MSDVRKTPDDALCVCGHLAEDHHRSWFVGGAELIEECEAWAEQCECQTFWQGGDHASG